jgi:hypothetical protein
MGLKENLKTIIQNTQKKGLCKFGGIYKQLPEEEKSLLVQVLRSEASTMEITRALNSDGIHIRREFVSEKRKCFTDPSIECCLGSERDGDCQ